MVSLGSSNFKKITSMECACFPLDCSVLGLFGNSLNRGLLCESFADFCEFVVALCCLHSFSRWLLVLAFLIYLVVLVACLLLLLVCLGIDEVPH